MVKNWLSKSLSDADSPNKLTHRTGDGQRLERSMDDREIMNNLEQAIYRARSFVEPAAGFTWGTKIYEPEDNDLQAPLKREIIAFCMKVIRHFENGMRDESITHFPSNTETYLSRVEEELTGPEQSDYCRFVEAIQHVIDTGNSR